MYSHSSFSTKAHNDVDGLRGRSEGALGMYTVQRWMCMKACSERVREEDALLLNILAPDGFK